MSEQKQWSSYCDCAECRRVTGRLPRTEPQSKHVDVYVVNGIAVAREGERS